MSIKARLAALNKRQLDLKEELRNRGYPNIQASELSAFINKHFTTPKAKAVLQLCDEILTEWEAQNEAAKPGEAVKAV